MARRAATVDAYRALYARVGTVRLSLRTNVSDLVATGPGIDQELTKFLRTGQVVDTRFYPDGACQVDVRISLQAVFRELRRIAADRNLGDRWPDGRFARLERNTAANYITATGTGRPPPASQPQPSPASVPPAPGSAPSVEAGGPDWAAGMLMATGYGVPPTDVAAPEQAQVIAERAAHIDAGRQLLNRIGSLPVRDQETVRDFAERFDDIRGAVDACVRSAVPAATRYNDDGSVEVDVEASAADVWRAVQPRLGPE